MKSHRYKGQLIERCERAPGEHRGRWMIQRYHLASVDGDRSLPYADELCPHFNTLADAREYIDESLLWLSPCLRCGRTNARYLEVTCAECEEAAK